ncbi:trypsin-like peptidase domain-containing protein [Clostridium botulinum]|jgi:serine protease Do|uniref:Protease n=3 Tax=Clostridium TaxID=1485 RepID=A0A2K9MX41_CLOSG|nr:MULTISPECIES: trypsin-like peptidase domain-containing protein [Clostridium]MBE6079133.1 PDZ domain-containing protein [Clostridium lundense]AUM97324.1 protease [Clostridium sporogenes]AVQ54774.1 PDZ domain-containing protein [Clostridium botulinum]EDU38207.1 trypsin [Clostridium sporogenes ATCC 15579]EJE7236066.1 trypsin-like peptidase domain-containing protein [Clostridium botulinum]
MDRDNLNNVGENGLNAEPYGEINFKKSRKRRRMKNILFIMLIIIVSALCGGVTASYIIDKKLEKNPYNPTNQSLFEQKSEKNEKENKNEQLPKNSITKVAESVGPAVVGISNKTEGYFGQEDQGSGSGIIFDPNGYIVTNNHVIDGAQKITIKLSTGKVLNASLVGTDRRSDLAVIKVDAKNLPVAKFGDSSKVKVGDVAIAIGNPLGEEFAGTVTAGIVSATNRKIQYAGAVYKLIQTDAAINPGNSGGALCNDAGEIIGINSLKEKAEGIGFAISINEAKDIIKSLMDYGKVSRPYLGVAGKTISSEQTGVSGAYVAEVVQGSGAAAAGIKPTDIIVELDGKKVTKFEDLADILDTHKVGDTVKAKILRNSKYKEINIILSEMKESNR